MSLDNILQKISDDSSIESKKNIDDANIVAQEILTKARKQASSLKSELFETSKNDASEERRRAITLAGLELRKKILEHKRYFIDLVFDKAKADIANIDDDKYFSLMKGFLDKTAPNGALLMVAEKRRKVWERMIAENKLYNLSFTNEDGFDGFIARTNNSEIDCSIDSIFKSFKDDLEPGVAEILFKGINA